MKAKQRLKRIAKVIDPPQPPVIRVIFVSDDGTVNYNGETMTQKEYEVRYPTQPEDTIIQVSEGDTAT